MQHSLRHETPPTCVWVGELRGQQAEVLTAHPVAGGVLLRGGAEGPFVCVCGMKAGNWEY